MNSRNFAKRLEVNMNYTLLNEKEITSKVLLKLNTEALPLIPMANKVYPVAM